MSRQHFVQGLEIVDDHLYLSVGQYGHSGLLRYHFPGMTLERSRKLDKRVFAEGVTVLGEHVYQLTWRNRALLVYQREDLSLKDVHPLTGEGWGLTNNGRELIYSDGSEHLFFISPDDGRVLRSMRVMEGTAPVRHLNELEWIDGEIWANIWQSDRIVVIDRGGW